MAIQKETGRCSGLPTEHITSPFGNESVKNSEKNQRSGYGPLHVGNRHVSLCSEPGPVTVKIIKVVLFFLWSLVVLISLNHLYTFIPLVERIPTLFLGLLGWGTALLSVLYFGREHWCSVALIALAAFCFGFSVGSYLDPPADPLEHLRRVHEWSCGKSAADFSRSNRGMWHYSMLTPILCVDKAAVEPENMFLRIHLANGLLWALACSVLYICGILVGLPRRWAVFSVCLCFLFFGTNRFSYFRYYSFAPSFTSIMIYWLWASVFFIRISPSSMVKGTLTALALVPVLWVNHNQEAIFLVFLLITWLLVNLFFLRPDTSANDIENRTNPARYLFRFKIVLAALLFILLWALPQSESFRDWLSVFFLKVVEPNHYRHLWTSWHGWYIGPRIRDMRIPDTGGNIGLLVGMLGIPYFWPGLLNGSSQKKLKIYLLALLPFIGYFTPLLHFIWASNLKAGNYYRLCYASMFWVFFADFLYRIEDHVSGVLTRILPNCKIRFHKKIVTRRIYYLFCFAGFIALGTIRSAPIYGKMDFYFLEEAPWWKPWQPMIEQVLGGGIQPIIADMITETVFRGVFAQPSPGFRFNPHFARINIEELIFMNNCLSHHYEPIGALYLLLSGETTNQKERILDLLSRVAAKTAKEQSTKKQQYQYRCVINLHDYPASWVPYETGHWSPLWSQPSHIYAFHGKRGKELRQLLRDNPPPGCMVFF